MIAIAKKSLFALALSTAFFTAASAKSTDLSGEWKLNEGKSTMGQFARMVPLKVKTSQSADSITVTKTSQSFNGNGENVFAETLSFDGKEIETTVPPRNAKRKASAKWSDDGKTLTVTYTLLLEFNGQSNEIKGTEVYVIAEDGKTLTVTNSSTSSFGENTYKAVYEK